jgi:hypothetical protein
MSVKKAPNPARRGRAEVHQQKIRHALPGQRGHSSQVGVVRRTVQRKLAQLGRVSDEGLTAASTGGGDDVSSWSGEACLIQ